MTTAYLRALDDCGCCEGVGSRTPAHVANRAGLSAITYRVGTHATFKQSMQARLSDSRYPILRDLQTREDDDFSLALLDAWASVADVLTFYQERIANESYLRTAAERVSLLELARLIGYELRPGVAAGAFVAFTLEEAPGAPEEATLVTEIAEGTQVQSVPGPGETAQTFETVETIEGRVEWNAVAAQTSRMRPLEPGDRELFLSGVDTRLGPGDGILIVGAHREAVAASNRWDFRLLETVDADPEEDHTRVTWKRGLGKEPVLPAGVDVKVYALRLRAALFGHNAPDPRFLSHSDEAPLNALVSGSTWNNYAITGDTIELDAAYPKVIQDSWVLLDTPIPPPWDLTLPGYRELYRVNAVSTPSRAAFGLSGKTTRIEPDFTGHLFLFDLRRTTVFAQSEQLEMAATPISDPVAGDRLVLSRQVDGLTKGQRMLLSGTELAGGEPASELVTLLETRLVGGLTEVRFTAPLQNTYERDTVSINANVAAATHGESVTEILGSGDASLEYQSFALRQTPLTHISAASASGTESTLEIYVNDVRWHEVPTFYQRGPEERVFITRIGDEDQTTVMFGDGRTGARLPTGQNNVRAVYRKGIGLEGLVGAGQLSQLKTRPLGIKGVTNQLPAEGAEDPESRDRVRRNAPLTVLALERTVSLQDYEDFTRAFAGIAKALATWTWDGRERSVFLTVAGPDGAEIRSDGQLYADLLEAIARAGDPHVRFTVRNYRAVLFRFGGRVRVHPDHPSENVLPAVEQALREEFSFDAREFGQHVMLSEVIAVIQAVAGVVAVDVDSLYREDQPQSLQARLESQRPDVGSAVEADAAELLTLNPAPLDLLEVMS